MLMMGLSVCSLVTGTTAEGSMSGALVSMTSTSTRIFETTRQAAALSMQLQAA